MRKIIDQFSGVTDRQIRWRLRNPDKYCNYQKKFRERNKSLTAKYNRKYYLQRREELNRLKCRPCQDCGIQYNPWVMQFDHRDPAQKKYALSQVNISYKHFKTEIAKCDIVCANCHFERTHKQLLAGQIKHYRGPHCGK